MKFLNNKEEVLDIEITQYGKYLLSKGKFNPEYYAFFDSDILYDGEYTGLNETQNNVHDRIKETPQLETQYLFHGVETEILKINKIIKQGGQDAEGQYKELNSKKIQQTSEKHYSLTAPIGSVSLESTSAPAWFLNVRKGEISGTIDYKSGSFANLKIPQLHMDSIEYQTYVKQIPANVDFEAQTELGILTNEFPDGSYVEITEDEMVVDFMELNSIDGNDNFQIEVFQIEDETVNSTTKENLIPLYFTSKKVELVKNGILLDDNEIQENLVNLDPSCVEYFFEVLVDDEVVEDVEEQDIKRDLYKTNVREEDILPC